MTRTVPSADLALLVILGAVQIGCLAPTVSDGGHGGREGDGGSEGQLGVEGDGGGGHLPGEGEGEGEGDGGEAGLERCNGIDDDGDRLIDAAAPDYVPPRCPLQLGVCADAVHACVGGELQMCDYGPSYLAAEGPEDCDGLDNDCDGETDELCECQRESERECVPVVAVCALGLGRSTQKCHDGVWGPCTTSGTPEICDGLDNDCDGRTDDLPDDETGHVCGEVCPDWNTTPVTATLGGVQVTVCVDRFEASHLFPGDPGLMPASVPGALPWTDIAFEDAQRACSMVAKQVCPREIWEAACAGENGTGSPYPAHGEGLEPGICNDRGVVGQAEPTASRPRCVSTWPGRGGNAEVGLIHDMSGNVAEWVGPGEAKGGSFATDREEDLGCTHWLPVDVASSPTIGFRCCSRVP